MKKGNRGEEKQGVKIKNSEKHKGNGAKRNMIIDWHAHLYPMHFKDYGTLPPALFQVDDLLAKQKKAGIDISVISSPLIMFGPGKKKRDITSLSALKEWNEWITETVKRSEGRLVALAATNPFGGPSFVKETKRAIEKGGLKGIVVSSNVKGEYLDSPKAYPLFELACELDVPIFIHPPSKTIGFDKMQDFRLIEMLGRPFDTTLSVARLILFGVLERYPQLKLVAAHMGGALMMLPGRLDFGYALRKDMSFGPWEPDVLSKPPSHYIRQIYVDSMGFHPPAVLCSLGTVGVDHVLYGSDFPPVTMPLRRSVDVVRNLPIAERDRKKVLGGNAARLLKLH